MKTLRTYQESAISSLFEYIFNEKDKTGVLVVAPVGSGKSLLIAEFIKRVHAQWPRTRIVMLSHVKELLEQDAAELRLQYPECDFGFYCASLGQKRLHNDVTFASIQSVWNKINAFNRCPEIIIIDECFTGDTQINTNKGTKRIDKVGCGDIVYTATGMGEVVAVSQKTSNEIYKVKLNDGREIRCTGNHPILSEQGWVECRKLDVGSKLFSIQDMPKLWETLSSVSNGCNKTRQNRGMASGKDYICQAKVLLNILLKEDGKCNVGCWGKGENARNTKENRSQAVYSWWEWQRCNKFSENDSGYTWERLDNGISSKNISGTQKWNVSQLLQSGLRKPNSKTCNRVGRGKSQREEKIIGQEEGRTSSFVRVESIEIEKSGSGEVVYNLQINGHPSYFANGILVHNCHLISHNDHTQYRKFIDSVLAINTNVKVLGFTGTPFRSDTGRLDEGDGKLFDGIAYQIDIGWMIEEGYLCRPVTPRVAKKMNVDGVKSRGGDYIAGQLEKAVDIDETTQACVNEIIEKGAGRNKWLVFTAGIQHCDHVCEAIRSHGITCEMITGDTDTKERDDIIARFKRGEIRCLVNVAVLTTGFNVPDIDLLAFMRPTKSPVLYIQTTGRGIRPVYADGYDLSTKQGRLDAIANSKKPDCLILDFGGVIENLGPIDSVEIRKKNTAKDPDAPKGDAIMKRCPACGNMCAAAQRFCYVCSYSFINDALNTKSEDHNAILSSDEPIEEREVIGLNLDKHYKGGNIESTPSLCVSYITMTGVYKEWICFEHKGYARDKAVHWHKKMMDWAPPPNTIDQALEWGYKKPDKIMIRKEGKYYRVKDVYVDFDKIDFQKEDTEKVSNSTPLEEPKQSLQEWASGGWLDDEIPF